VLKALYHAHRNGILHCDVKPANIVFLDEQDSVVPVLADFGGTKGALFRMYICMCVCLRACTCAVATTI